MTATNGHLGNVQVVETPNSLSVKPLNIPQFGRPNTLSIPGSTIVELTIETVNDRCEYQMLITKSNGDTQTVNGTTDQGVTNKALAVFKVSDYCMSNISDKIIIVFDNQEFDDILINPYYLSDECCDSFTQPLKQLLDHIKAGRLRFVKVNPIKNKDIKIRGPCRHRYER